MELHDSSTANAFLLDLSFPSPITKYSFDKVFTDRGVVQASFLFHWKKRKGLLQRGRKNSGSLLARMSLFGVHLHAMDSAAGRILFKNISI